MRMKGWSIVEHAGSYYGSFWRTRKEAIADHERAIGKPWKEMHKLGARAVKSTLTWRA